MALSEIEAPGAGHFVFFLDSENSMAPTIVTGPAGSLTVYRLPYSSLEVTAPVLAADADDWDFEDLSEAHVVRVAASVPGVKITGIESSAVPPTAKRKLIINVGSIALTLADENVASVATNRLKLFGGAGDITLQPWDAQELYLDDTSGPRWITV
jgi:hypothetical protein